MSIRLQWLALIMKLLRSLDVVFKVILVGFVVLEPLNDGSDDCTHCVVDVQLGGVEIIQRRQRWGVPNVWNLVWKEQQRSHVLTLQVFALEDGNELRRHKSGDDRQNEGLYEAKDVIRDVDPQRVRSTGVVRLPGRQHGLSADQDVVDLLPVGVDELAPASSSS